VLRHGINSKSFLVKAIDPRQLNLRRSVALAAWLVIVLYAALAVDLALLMIAFAALRRILCHLSPDGSLACVG
jgi:hypothetical protein